MNFLQPFPGNLDCLSLGLGKFFLSLEFSHDFSPKTELWSF
jgi:hypothetical protein